MNAADRLKTFLDGIESYVTAKNILPTKFNPEFALAETLSLEDLDRLTQDECFNYAYQLLQFADHVSHEKAQCENVVSWCNKTLGSIMVQEMDHQAIAKHEVKYSRVLVENELADKIDEWKITAQGRLESIKSREYNVRRKADILLEKGKRR